jgi:hypothetical protein
VRTVPSAADLSVRGTAYVLARCCRRPHSCHSSGRPPAQSSGRDKDRREGRGGGGKAQGEMQTLGQGQGQVRCARRGGDTVISTAVGGRSEEEAEA